MTQEDLEKLKVAKQLQDDIVAIKEAKDDFLAFLADERQSRYHIHRQFIVTEVQNAILASIDDQIAAKQKSFDDL